MKLRIRMAALFAFALLASSVAWAAPPDDCHQLRKRGRRAEARQCYDELTRNRDPYLRAEGYWGLEMYQEANDLFRDAVAQQPDNPLYRVRWGRLMHERFNNAEAVNLFQEALELDADNAQAHLGIALVRAEEFDRRAVESATKALELNPRLVEAQELLASLALEESKPEEAVRHADAALRLSDEALDAMAVRAAVEVLADRSPDVWINRIRQFNPSYGEGYALIAHHLVLNRRYEEGIAYYRRAIEADPQLWSARSQLGINLMRLGQEEEPRQHLEISYDAGYRNAATVNTLRLLDSYKNFTIYRDGNTILKLQTSEAELLRPYFEAELKRAMATYERKYGVELPQPVQLEVYPNHEDFAVRTMGMPGLGALGVAFGNVVAMDSPSARRPGSFHWASTLWHELSHVYILNLTNHRVPRWFTEGLAVHEETEASPEWGDRVTPEILLAIRDKKLLPIADLDSGFVRPKYPEQVIVSYFQGGRICDFIKSRWGDEKLLAMAHAFADVRTTEDVVREQLGMEPEEFDRQFLAWLDQQLGRTAANFDAWRAGLRELADLAEVGNHDQVLVRGEQVRQMYPDYIGGANAYEFLAEAHLAKGDKQSAAAVLADYQQRGGRNPAALKQLASLQEELGRPQDAAATLDRINYIYPVNDEDLHRRLGDLWFEQGNYEGAIREYGALVALNPLDQADAHYNLARAYFADGQQAQASDHILTALEAAPGYRPAQRLLLQIEDSKKGQ